MGGGVIKSASDPKLNPHFNQSDPEDSTIKLWENMDQNMIFERWGGDKSNDKIESNSGYNTLQSISNKLNTQSWFLECLVLRLEKVQSAIPHLDDLKETIKGYKGMRTMVKALLGYGDE